VTNGEPESRLKRRATHSKSNSISKGAPPVEFVAHKRNEKSKPRPFKTERVGHPEKRNQSLGDDVLEWYHPSACCRQEK
jgi:hypothetical protein